MKELMDHEKLEVNDVILDFLPVATHIAHAGKSYGDFQEQLETAALSIAANLGEGAGEFANGEKIRFYRYSKRSAIECAALIASASRLKLITDDDEMKARSCLL